MSSDLRLIAANDHLIRPWRERPSNLCYGDISNKDFIMNTFTLGAALSVGLIFLAHNALAADNTRTPIGRDQASDNTFLCRNTGGFIVRTPTVVACCIEESDGSYSCTGCHHDGTHCANYSVITGSKNDLRRSLMTLKAPVVTPAAPRVAAPPKPGARPSSPGSSSLITR